MQDPDFPFAHSSPPLVWYLFSRKLPFLKEGFCSGRVHIFSTFMLMTSLPLPSTPPFAFPFGFSSLCLFFRTSVKLPSTGDTRYRYFFASFLCLLSQTLPSSFPLLKIFLREVLFSKSSLLHFVSIFRSSASSSFTLLENRTPCQSRIPQWSLSFFFYLFPNAGLSPSRSPFSLKGFSRMMWQFLIGF